MFGLSYNNKYKLKRGGSYFGKENRPKWILILTILLILVAIIIDVSTHADFNTSAQKAMVGLWAGLLGLYFIAVIVAFGIGIGITNKILHYFLMVIILLQLIFGCVSIGISKTKLSNKEYGILYGRLITIYLALFAFHIGRLFQDVSSRGVTADYKNKLDSLDD